MDGTESDWRAQRAWRSTTMALLLAGLGLALSLIVNRSVPNSSPWPALSGIGFNLLLAVLLLLRRHSPNLRLSELVLVCSVASVLLALWFINPTNAAAGRAWMPFQANKLGMIIVALLAPELPVGLLCILAYGVFAVVQMAQFPAEIRNRFAAHEPFATITFTLFTVVLLALRIRQLRREHEFARALTERAELERFAKMLVAVRDLSNTPLQTIEFAAGVARTVHPDLAPLMERIERAIGALKELDGRLKGYEDAVPWSKSDASFDSLAALQDRNKPNR